MGAIKRILLKLAHRHAMCIIMAVGNHKHRLRRKNMAVTTPFGLHTAHEIVDVVETDIDGVEHLVTLEGSIKTGYFPVSGYGSRAEVRLRENRRRFKNID